MKDEELNLVCGENCPHYNKIEQVKKVEPSREEILNLSDMFKIFADDTRLRIICEILNEELCVCDLCELLDLNQSTVSHQLQILRNSKLVKNRREGKQVFYSLQDEHVEKIIKMALEHILEKEGK
ncbi:MAG: ArsR/SmtB family transcription factor [Clostridia bacterium]